MLNIYLIGDSLSVGVLGTPKIVSSESGLDANVIGMPVVGATTKDMMVQAGALAGISPDVVHIMAGTNDAASGATADQIVNRLTNLVTRVRANVPSRTIIVITPPPPTKNKWNNTISELSTKIGRIPGAYIGAQVLPVTALSMDGVHPASYTGLAKIVGQNIRRAIGSAQAPNVVSNALNALALAAVSTIIIMKLTQRRF